MRYFNTHALLSLALGLLMLACADKPDTVTSEISVIPRPINLTQAPGGFKLDASTSISCASDQGSMETATLLREKLKNATGFDFPVKNKKASKNSISLEIRKDLAKEAGAEGYRLISDSEGVKIQAAETAGLINGIQTLRQLLPKKIESPASENKGTDWTIPAVEIEDKPLYAYRGMLIDYSRHFFSKAYTKKFLDYMALYKYNVFHMHLTDDPGWRIEIKKHPRLTEEAAYRTENGLDRHCKKQAETDSTFVTTKDFFVEKDGKTVYGGFFAQDDIKEIIEYARVRNITVIPEIDMPGHFSSANIGKNVSCFGRGSGTLCPGKEEAFDYVQGILDEVCELFPAPYIHIGADEVGKWEWKRCPDCQRRIKNEGLKNEDELQSYFVKRIERYLNKKGKKMMGWDEILEGGMSPTATMMFWRSSHPDAPLKALQQGNQVVMTPNSHWYFDYPQDINSLRRTYSYDPMPVGATTEQQKLLLGGQGCMWAERIPSELRMDYMAMPRMLALSEALWTPKENKSWNHFENRIVKHFGRLDLMNVHYRIPILGNVQENNVFLDKKEVRLLTSPGNLTVRYTTDGSAPGPNAPKFDGSLQFEKNSELRLQAFNSKNRGSDVMNVKLEKEGYRIPTKPVAPQPGLACKYVPLKKGIGSVKDIMSNAKSVTETVVANVTYPENIQKSHFGLIFNGYIKVPEEGIYTFQFVSDDGGILKIAGKTLGDNDGNHGPRQKIGQIALAAGYHPIAIDYFQGGGGMNIELHLVDKQGQVRPVPQTWFYHKDSKASKTVSLK
ncbi:beta-N-acetylhexosaminidase [Fulvitalea axinellae]|uniref:beta-N-acetylhexosaminidase n=1 Tax=Fulvitalea axinellae TaxID=1182444 RepID=A0AAU9DEN6_9BACT|nr:beta-N-acetylhexosaminidase [Fulvitalea axinellae]